MVASERLHLPPELFAQTLQQLLVPVATDLARLAVKKSKSHRGSEKSVRLAVSMLAKTVLQYIEVVQGDKDFYALWQAVLQALQTTGDCHEYYLPLSKEEIEHDMLHYSMLLQQAASGKRARRTGPSPGFGAATSEDLSPSSQRGEEDNEGGHPPEQQWAEHKAVQQVVAAPSLGMQQQLPPAQPQRLS